MKKIAVVASGWHFPSHFYEMISKQVIPNGWCVDLFCISHRDPGYAVKNKKEELKEIGYSRRQMYDRILYRSIISKEDIEKLGWKYFLEPNTVGDWGNSNQWLEKNNYKDYDLFLFTHDDNFILNDHMFVDLVDSGDWLILSNSEGVPRGSIRGSFEFFKKDILDMLGGKFDLSMTNLSRENKLESSSSMDELGDWNSTVTPLNLFIEKNRLKSRIWTLSSFYRVSAYCIEGERGYINHTYILNSKSEEKGLDVVERLYQKGFLYNEVRGAINIGKIKLPAKDTPSKISRIKFFLGYLKGRLIKFFGS